MKFWLLYPSQKKPSSVNKTPRKKTGRNFQSWALKPTLVDELLYCSLELKSSLTLLHLRFLSQICLLLKASKWIPHAPWLAMWTLSYFDRLKSSTSAAAKSTCPLSTGGCRRRADHHPIQVFKQSLKFLIHLTGSSLLHPKQKTRTHTVVSAFSHRLFSRLAWSVSPFQCRREYSTPVRAH